MKIDLISFALIMSIVVLSSAYPEEYYGKKTDDDDDDDGGYEYEGPEIVCPECKKFNNLTCHIQAIEGFAFCECPVCMTKCPVIDSPCPKGSTCVMQFIGCNFPPCSIPSAQCVPFTECRKTRCSTPCKTGYINDHNGCQTCLCKDPCKELVCGADLKCVGEVVSGEDPKYSCQKVAPSTCPPCIKYNNLTCHMSGNEKNEDECECPICVTLCPVEDNPCQKDEKCVMDDLKCNFQNPCGLVSAKCVPFTGCEKPVCASSCEFGYLNDHNGCETCLCSDPCKELGCTACNVESSPGKDKIYSCIK